MGLFDKKKSLSRKDIGKKIEQSSGIIPETGGKKYTRAEREKIAKGVFNRKYGGQISRDDYKKVLRELETQERKAKTRTERDEIKDKKEYLRELGGFEDYEI